MFTETPNVPIKKQIPLFFPFLTTFWKIQNVVKIEIMDEKLSDLAYIFLPILVTFSKIKKVAKNGRLTGRLYFFPILALFQKSLEKELNYKWTKS